MELGNEENEEHLTPPRRSIRLIAKQLSEKADGVKKLKKTEENIATKNTTMVKGREDLDMDGPEREFSESSSSLEESSSEAEKGFRRLAHGNYSSSSSSSDNEDDEVKTCNKKAVKKPDIFEGTRQIPQRKKTTVIKKRGPKLTLKAIDKNQNHQTKPKSNCDSNDQFKTLESRNFSLTFLAPAPTGFNDNSPATAMGRSSTSSGVSSWNSTAVSSSVIRMSFEAIKKSALPTSSMIERPVSIPSTSKKPPEKAQNSSDSDSDGDEWEEMETINDAVNRQKGVVEVLLEGKAAERFAATQSSINPNTLIDPEKAAREAADRAKWERAIRAELTRRRRELAESCHKVHILGAVAHIRLAAIALLDIRDVLAKAFEAHGFDTVPPFMVKQMEGTVRTFRTKFMRREGGGDKDAAKKGMALGKWLTNAIKNGTFEYDVDLALIFFAYSTFVLHLPTRLCYGFNPIPRLETMPTKLKKSVPSENKTRQKNKGVKKAKTTSNTMSSPSSSEHDEISSEDEEKSTKRRRRSTANINRKTTETNRETVACDSTGASVTTESDFCHYYWNEYFDENERRWICIDPLCEEVDQSDKIERRANGPQMLYVIGIDDELGVRELAAKYSADFLKTNFRKMRTDAEWLKETFALKILASNETRARLEDAEIHERLKRQPMPAIVSEFKNHPLYALEKDLLKFEAIYPPNTASLGQIRGYDIFPRSAVHKLEGSLNWIKVARSIREGEKPYKVVKARPKMKIPKELRTPLTLDVYGYWQTEPYVPPEVVEGKIPRNEFGNIYMYQESMVPRGCVHLRLPGIFNVARRLDLEAVPAVIGWNFAGCNNVPVIDGCVVLQKDEEVLRAAWQESARAKASKEAKKASERVWRNWRRLIRGKMLLEQMRKRFGT